MILVGICGGIGTGKTTFSSLLAENAASYGHWESWQLIAEVANGLREQRLEMSSIDDLHGLNLWLQRLPELVLQVTHQQMNVDLALVTAEKIAYQPDSYTKLLEYVQMVIATPELQTGVITEPSKEQFRNILQWLGGFLAKSVSGSIWYDEIVRRIQLMPELELATVGGVRFPADANALRQSGGFIVRMERSLQPHRDLDEVTERETHLIEPDTTVYNNGSLLNLGSCASVVYRDLKQSQLQPEYYAFS